MGYRGPLFAVSVLVVVLAASLYHPVPRGWKQPTQTRLMLAFHDLFFEKMGAVKHLLGLDLVEHLRWGFSVFARLSSVPPHLEAAVATEGLVLGDVPARLYRPQDFRAGQGPLRAGMVYYHGGGWTIGDLDTMDVLLRRMVKDLQVVIVSVGYRLAPEAPFPAAVDDCSAATRDFLTSAEKHGVDPARVAVAGDSAGGNLAAAVCLQLRDEAFLPLPKLQVLFYPSLQMADLHTPSEQANSHGPVIYRRALSMYFTSYTQGHLKNMAAYDANEHVPRAVLNDLRAKFMPIKALPDDYIKMNYKPVESPETSELWEEIKDVLLNPYLAPLFAEDLSGLPAAWINVCQLDVLRDDGIWYAHRLRAAGVKVTLEHRDCYHGWNLATEDLESADLLLGDVIAFIQENL